MLLALWKCLDGLIAMLCSGNLDCKMKTPRAFRAVRARIFDVKRDVGGGGGGGEAHKKY
jgi:hypothetical protein